LGSCFLERDGDEATFGFQDLKRALRFCQIAAKQQQDTSMPRRERRCAIKGSLGASGIGVIVDRWMTGCIRPAGAILEALVGISPAGIQHGEPGERGEVHRSCNLVGSGWGAQGKCQCQGLAASSYAPTFL
jgi:hypothetical protein